MGVHFPNYTMVPNRMLKYILEKADLTIADVEKHFENIDNRINRVKNGETRVYSRGLEFDEFFAYDIIKIVDESKGIVELNWAGTNRHYSVMSITYFLFKEETEWRK